MIGLMLAGILSGALSAGMMLITGHSVMTALLAYALGGLAASVVIMTLMLARMTAASVDPSGMGDARPRTDAKHP